MYSVEDSNIIRKLAAGWLESTNIPQEEKDKICEMAGSEDTEMSDLGINLMLEVLRNEKNSNNAKRELQHSGSDKEDS